MKLLNFLFLLVSYQMIAAENVSIHYANDTEPERLKAKQVHRLIDKYDLEKWWFTEVIAIDSSVNSPFSHPILTLPATRPNNDLSGLSQLLHEQIHWFEDARQQKVASTIAELKKMYPKVPVGYPEGARIEFSSYLHLAVCLMELDALSEVVGKEKAELIISTNGKYFYKWIYKTVLADQEKIRTVLINNGLYI